MGRCLIGLRRLGEGKSQRRMRSDWPLSNRDCGIHTGAVWALVDADVSKLSSKRVRVNITLPERVLAIVDESAKREGETRSGLLVWAALGYVDDGVG